ncbi:MAG: NADH-quinone oxidoreductase subunit L [Cytophagales bacterium]|nr:NADH-quinone oxidoreductase subunit L [Cytophagales bacterium]
MSVWTIYSLILLLPLLQGMVIYLSRKKSLLIPFVLVGMLTGLLLTLNLLFFDLESSHSHRFEWFPGFEIGWRLDQISLSLIALVYFISLLVHLFSSFYLEGEERYRYFGKLGFFTFSMIGLLAADHLLLLFVFWELVGFASYLLIGFWYKDINNSQASRNAFITNRVADVLLLAGILTLWVNTGNLFVSDLNAMEATPWLTFASVGLLVGAMGKSAQFPFHTWLPHAMAGPTPVSALIHAATMVAAGVYLLIRVSIIFPEPVMMATAIIGAFTVVMAAFFALTQFDIKKVLAYSTISQLGYMILAIGVSSVEMAFFHLWTHAFFKAALFLTAGAIIHEMHHRQPKLDPQDMRFMGDLRQSMPVTFLAYSICLLALVGLPFFSGFFSKDGILLAAVIKAKSFGGIWTLIPVLGLTGVLMTAFYMVRQWRLVFFKNELEATESNKEAEPLFTVKLPLILLALGSLWFWYGFNPIGDGTNLTQALFGEKDHAHYFWLPMISVGLGIAGMAFAYVRYNNTKIEDRTLMTAERLNPIQKLSFQGLYLDQLYEKAFIRSYNQLALLSKAIDERVIDPFLHFISISTVVLAKTARLFDHYVIDGFVNFAAWLSRTLGWFLKQIQSKDLQSQFFILLMVILLVLLLLINTNL